MPRGMLLLHVPVSTKRPWIQYVNYPICDCSELNNAAARASDTPTEMEIRRQPQRKSATRARCVVGGGRSASMLSELHHSHQSFILIILFFIVVHEILIIVINVLKLQYAICQGTCCHSTYPYKKICHGFKRMIPRVTQLPVLPKLPHKTRPHATNEPPKTSLTGFFGLCQQD